MEWVVNIRLHLLLMCITGVFVWITPVNQERKGRKKMIRSRWRKMRGDEYCFNVLKIRNNNPLFGDPTGDSALDEM